MGGLWENLGGFGLISPPTAVSGGNKNLNVFATSATGQVMRGWYGVGTGGDYGFQGWQELSLGTLITAPAAVSWGANRLDVFAIGPDLKMYHNYLLNDNTLGVWPAGWEDLGGQFVVSPLQPGPTAPTPDSFGSFANYLLCTPAGPFAEVSSNTPGQLTSCQHLVNVQVQVFVAIDLVGSSGFSLQLNATSPPNPNGNNTQYIVWQQYFFVMDGQTSALLCGINSWTALELADPNGYPSFIQWWTLIPLPTANTIPAGSMLEISLGNGGAQDDVTEVTFLFYNPSLGVKTLPISLFTTPGETSVGETTANVAPIVAFELDLVGPDSRLHTDLSSAGGAIFYTASTPLSALGALPSRCVGTLATTGESSNSVYSPMTPFPTIN
jgi:hypothetical protein